MDQASKSRKLKLNTTTKTVAITPEKQVPAIVFHNKELGVESPGLAIINGNIKLIDSESPQSSPSFSSSDLAVLSIGIASPECSIFLAKHGIDTSPLDLLV